jgi:protein TonB
MSRRASRVLVPLLGSLAVHGAVGAVIGRLSGSLPRLVQQTPLEIAVVETAPPPPPPKALPPEKPKPAPIKMARAPRPPAKPAELPRAVKPSPPSEAPPPPTSEAKDPTPRPLIVTGITLESTTSEGSAAVATGNTLGGDPGRAAHEPAAVKPYKAERYAPAAQVSELPRLLNRDTVDLRKYYPPAALKKEFEGDVILRLLIDADGTVVKVDLVSDPGEGLGAAALRAVRDYRFAPAKINGVPVATTVSFPFRFVIN